VLELPIALGRPREPGDPAVGELHDRLLRRHPELLAGAPDHSGEDPAGGSGGDARRGP
jgi:hypothetical protein